MPKLYVIDVANDTIEQYDLSTVWDLSSVGTVEGTLDTSSLFTSATKAISLSEDGLTAYLTGNSGATEETKQLTLGVAWKISTAVDSGLSFDTSEAANDAFMQVRKGETKFYVSEINADIIREYDITGGDISTASYTGNSLDVSGEINGTNSTFYMTTNGEHIYVSDEQASVTIFQYDLLIPYDLSSGSYSGKSKTLTKGGNSDLAMVMRHNGTRFFVENNSSPDSVEQYTLGTAYDISTASDDSVSLTLTNNGAVGPRSMEVSENLTIAILSGSSFAAYIEDGNIRATTNVLTGLGNLEGECITVFADGNTEDCITVVDGQIVIPGLRTIARAQLGLSYITDIVTLDVEVHQPPKTIQGQFKKITEVMIRFLKSRMPLVGPNFNDMTKIKHRDDEKWGEANKLITGDRYVNIPPEWNGNGRIHIRHLDPTALTILGIFPDLSIENKGDDDK